MVLRLFSGCCKIGSSQGEGSNICGMEEPEMCQTAAFPTCQPTTKYKFKCQKKTKNLSAHRLSSSTTDLRVWQHHHYPIACHLLLGVITFSQPFLYFQVKIMTFLRITQLPFVLYFESMALILHSSKQLFLQKLFRVEQ